MKTKQERTVFKCDFCNKIAGDYAEHCLKCGKDVCIDCRISGKVGIEYSHSVHCNGTGDGWYCNKCDGELRSRLSQGLPKDPLHTAYVAIHDFKIHIEQQYRDNTAEKNRLEANLKKAQGNSL